MAKEWTNEDKAWNIVFTRLGKDSDKLTREGLKNLLVEVMDEKDKYWKDRLKRNDKEWEEHERLIRAMNCDYDY